MRRTTITEARVAKEFDTIGTRVFRLHFTEMLGDKPYNRFTRDYKTEPGAHRALAKLVAKRCAEGAVVDLAATK